MKTIKFQCNDCGECCQHLLERTELGTRGLNLQRNEIHLFLSDHVKPMYSVSEGEVFTYQLNLDTCPHFNTETKKCGIYENRPLVCRSFPFQASVVSRKCPLIDAQLGQDEPFTVNDDLIRLELEANRLHMQYLQPYLGREEYYSYDLETGRWLRMRSLWLKGS